MNIKPDRKLVIKQWLVLSTLSLLAVITSSIIHLLIYLVEGNVPAQTAAILWLVTFSTIILLWLIAVPLIILWIRNLSYRIDADRIIIFKGILTKVEQNIPYRAVTDFMLHRSLFDRYLGIGSICIQTAGQTQNPSGFEGKLSGLIDHKKLHQELREKLQQLHPVSEALTTAENIGSAEKNLMAQILEELKAIRKQLENN